jgi:hypothetical protein
MIKRKGAELYRAVFGVFGKALGRHDVRVIDRTLFEACEALPHASTRASSRPSVFSLGIARCIVCNIPY